MDLTRLLLAGAVDDRLRLGGQWHVVQALTDWENMTQAEGDIPGLSVGEYCGMWLEVAHLHDVVLGIKVSMQDAVDSDFEVVIQGKNIPLKNAHFAALLTVFTATGIPWEVDVQNTGGQSVAIKIHEMAILQFSFFEGQDSPTYLGAFDWEQYRLLQMRHGS